MSGTEAIGAAVNEIVTVLDDAQKRRRIENALLNLADEDVCKHIDKMLGAGAADLTRAGLRNILARRAGSGDSDNNPDSGVKK